VHRCSNDQQIRPLRMLADCGSRRCSREHCKAAGSGAVDEALAKAGYVCDHCPEYMECLSCYPVCSQIARSAASTKTARQSMGGEELVLSLLSCLRLQAATGMEASGRDIFADARCALAAVLESCPAMRVFAFNVGALSLPKLRRTNESAIAFRWQKAVTAVRRLLLPIAAERSGQTPLRYSEFPLLLLYDVTDASEVARSIEKSIAAALPERPVWTEASGVGRVERVVRECDTCIVLLTSHVFDNSYVMNTLISALNPLNGPPVEVVLIKMDGVTWQGQLFPPLNAVPSEIKRFLQQAIHTSEQQLNTQQQDGQEIGQRTQAYANKDSSEWHGRRVGPSLALCSLFPLCSAVAVCVSVKSSNCALFP
jgi:hypothetical protein